MTSGIKAEELFLDLKFLSPNILFFPFALISAFILCYFYSLIYIGQPDKIHNNFRLGQQVNQQISLTGMKISLARLSTLYSKLQIRKVLQQTDTTQTKSLVLTEILL